MKPIENRQFNEYSIFMLFNSYEFLFLFLPLVLLGYYVLFRLHGRIVFLTLMSYVFYGWWDYRFCSLMLISTLVDYCAGKRIALNEKTSRKRGWLLVSLISNLSLLGFFKYWDLLAVTLNKALFFLPAGCGSISMPVLNIILPVGISFYTFQSMSYSIDIYMGKANPTYGFWRFACYVALFPQLIAGPIVRYRDIEAQLNQRTHSWDKALNGCRFFIMGLAKKVLIADGVAVLVGPVFDQGGLGFWATWIGVLAYAMQIYFDFSGYSDMAVGLGLMFGFRFPINFNSPYKAVSITDFWRRWHISLSTWLRDYLYIPLGGNQQGPWRTYANLFITMLLGGLWHGASWTFVFWGGYHGLLLAAERMNRKRGLFCWTPRWMQCFLTFLLVAVGWVFFRSASFSGALDVLQGMIGLRGGFELSFTAEVLNRLPIWMLFLSVSMAFSLPNSWEILNLQHGFQGNLLSWTYKAWGGVLLIMLIFVVCVFVILVNSSSPFLYFQF